MAESRDWESTLKEAAEIVARSELPENLRPVAFKEVLGSLVGKTGTFDESQASAFEELPDTPLGRIARKLGMDIEAAREVFFEDGGRLGIGIPTSRLDPSKAGGTKQLALLLAAGRQGGGYDNEWTPAAEIRRVCSDFGRFDSGNFASTLSEMGDVFQFRGSRQQREVKLRRVGFEMAGGLARDLSGIRNE